MGRCSTGRVWEGTAELRDPQTGKTTHVRRVTVKLSQPTRDGDMEIHLVPTTCWPAVKGALRGVHGEETMETKVSNYFLTDEISGVYKGMMIALPPREWEIFQTMCPARLATYLRRWARTANLENYPKHPRGPKKAKPRRPNAQFKHVATAKLLDEAKQLCRKQRKPKSASP